MHFLFDPNVWASFIALSALEIVLGIDNVIFLSIVTEKLSQHDARRARQIGLALALLFRIAILLTVYWIIGLTEPLVRLLGQPFSLRDFILIAGGLFLIVKATQEVHGEIEGDEDENETAAKPLLAARFSAVIAQIVLIDAIFSIELDHYGSRHVEQGRGDDRRNRGGHRRHVCRRRAGRGFHRAAPDHQDAGADLPDADRRRSRR